MTATLQRYEPAGARGSLEARLESLLASLSGAAAAERARAESLSSQLAASLASLRSEVGQLNESRKAERAAEAAREKSLLERVARAEGERDAALQRAARAAAGLEAGSPQ